MPSTYSETVRLLLVMVQEVESGRALISANFHVVLDVAHLQEDLKVHVFHNLRRRPLSTPISLGLPNEHSLEAPNFSST